MSDPSNFFFDKIDKIFQKEKINLKNKKIAIALSGGSDSLALTLLLKQYCDKKKIELVTVTIDHQIRSSSGKEAQQLSEILSAINIAHHILKIPKKKIPQKNIEAKLREMRYELLHDFCQKNNIKYLFLGHILGDIAENFLIRLFRGSGLDGLSPIAEISTYKEIKLVRPLLDFSKDELQDFLRQKNIKWFEDETNIDEKFLRNKIRNFFNSFEEKNLICKRVKSASDEIAKMRDFFDVILLKEARKILTFKDFSFLINLPKLKKLEEKIALKILALVLIEIGGKSYKPRLEKLKNFYQYLGEKNIKPYKFYGCITKKFDEKHIIISPENLDKKSPLKLKTILAKAVI